jgi:hypothetical protein
MLQRLPLAMHAVSCCAPLSRHLSLHAASDSPPLSSAPACRVELSTLEQPLLVHAVLLAIAAYVAQAVPSLSTMLLMAIAGMLSAST